MLGALFRTTLTTPREAAAQLLALRLGRGDAVSAVLLVSALGGLALGLLSGGALEMPTEVGTLVLSPMAYAALLAVGLIVGAMALASAGRALGGHGDLAGALVLVAWLQVLDLVLQVGVALVAALLGGLGFVVLIVALAAFVWIAVTFVRELHGVSAARAVAIIVIATLALGLALGIVVSLLPWGAPTDA